MLARSSSSGSRRSRSRASCSAPACASEWASEGRCAPAAFFLPATSTIIDAVPGADGREGGETEQWAMTRPVPLNNIDHADLKVVPRFGAAFGDQVNQLAV